MRRIGWKMLNGIWVYLMNGRFLIWSPIRGYTTPLMDVHFLFTGAFWMGLKLPFNKFKGGGSKSSQISPSQLHMVTWPYIMVFQYFYEDMGGILTLKLLFHLFHVQHTFSQEERGKIMFSFCHVKNFFWLFLWLGELQIPVYFSHSLELWSTLKFVCSLHMLLFFPLDQVSHMWGQILQVLES